MCCNTCYNKIRRCKCNIVLLTLFFFLPRIINVINNNNFIQWQVMAHQMHLYAAKEMGVVYRIQRDQLT